jgi:hypothetical protein
MKRPNLLMTMCKTPFQNILKTQIESEDVERHFIKTITILLQYVK